MWALGLLLRARAALGTPGGRMAGVVILAAVAFFTYSAVLWNKGHQAATEGVEDQNEKAGTAADAAEIDLLRCLEPGGVFDFATGQCRGSE